MLGDPFYNTQRRRVDNLSLNKAVNPKKNCGQQVCGGDNEVVIQFMEAVVSHRSIAFGCVFFKFMSLFVKYPNFNKQTPYFLALRDSCWLADQREPFVGNSLICLEKIVQFI